MLGLVAHAREVTSKLFAGLQSLDDVDSLSSIIDDYVKYETYISVKAPLTIYFQELGEHCALCEGEGGEVQMGSSVEQARRRRGN
jgi:hypothetical protein